MRILTLCYEFPPIGGGGARVAYGLARELVRSGEEVDLVTTRFGGLRALERVDGVQVHRVRALRSRECASTPIELASYVTAALPAALRLVRSRRYDINHTHFIFPDGIVAYALWRRTGLPYVITAHGSDVPGYNPERFGYIHHALAPLWRTIVRHAAGLVCSSESLRTLVRARHAGLDPILIPNGIDPERFCPDREKRRRVLVVSRMVERKGVQYLLDALQGVDTGYEVHIVGDGPYLSALREQADQLGVPVCFHGWLDNGSRELRTLYEESSIFVLTSESENFPIVLLEAMTAGMAIITTASTGCAEVVGDAAELVPPRDSVALRTALVALMGDPERRRRLGMAARRQLEERFSWQAVAREYVRCYERVVPYVADPLRFPVALPSAGAGYRMPAERRTPHATPELAGRPEIGRRGHAAT
ncbi:MAG TPA: glycosyltransferase family 4 protein [Gemmatimonadaceae bacterium]|nr:glycosyltransferase family 4 protein [Gemmatimonadaceae bacterium]